MQYQNNYAKKKTARVSRDTSGMTPEEIERRRQLRHQQLEAHNLKKKNLFLRPLELSESEEEYDEEGNVIEKDESDESEKDPPTLHHRFEEEIANIKFSDMPEKAHLSLTNLAEIFQEFQDENKKLISRWHTAKNNYDDERIKRTALEKKVSQLEHIVATYKKNEETIDSKKKTEHELVNALFYQDKNKIISGHSGGNSGNHSGYNNYRGGSRGYHNNYRGGRGGYNNNNRGGERKFGSYKKNY